MYRNKLFINILVSIYIVFSISFGIYLWLQHSKTVVTYSDKRVLTGYDQIAIAGDNEFPPFSYTDEEGLYSGYEADLILALQNWLEVDFSYKQVTWNEAVTMLEQGEIEALSGMRITESRERAYSFTEPYLSSMYSFIFFSGQDLDTLLTKEDVSVAVQKGSATYLYLVDNLYSDNMSVVFTDSPTGANELLLSLDVDLWFENYQVARNSALRTGSLDLLHFFTVEDSRGEYAMAFGKEHEVLLPLINKALLNLREDGTLAELDRKWFGLPRSAPEVNNLRTIIPVSIYMAFTILTLVIFWNGLLMARVEKKTHQLRESEEKFKATFEGTRDAIIIITTTGELIDCNQNAVTLFGYSFKEELLESGLRSVSFADEKNGENGKALFHDQILHEVGANSKKRFERAIHRADGLSFMADVAVAAYSLNNQEAIQVNISDITNQKEYQSQLEYLSLYDQLTGLFNRNYFEAELNRLNDSRFYPITLISCDLDGLKLINDTLGHQAGDQILKACARVLKGSLRESDILARVGGDEFSAILPRTNIKTGEKVARRIRDNLFHYNNKHPELPMSISLGIATAVTQETLLSDLFKQADDLMYRDKLYSSTSIHNRVVKGLMAALAERDYITEGHVRRLEKYCRIVGEKLNLTSNQLTNLALLAQVHDLGKVGIPDHILFKPGALDDDEWEIMKQHAEKGFRIAKASPDLNDVAELILKHHERWDGRGYPHGLEKEEIPIECRILAVVDAYDAMTNDRPYARTKSHEEAIQELKDGSGSQFDSQIVDVFIAVYCLDE